ncbi:MAG: adenosylhomocysteinase, partial [Nitrososphaerales archaeon]
AMSRMAAVSLAEDYVRKTSSSKRPFSGLYLAACLHVSKETAVLLSALGSLGMEAHLVAANPLSSQDEIAAYLSSIGMKVHGRRQESVEEYLKQIENAAGSGPDLIVDDGGELHVAYAKTDSTSCFGGTDETTSGTQRLMALERNGLLRYPVIPVNEARTKHIFDNKYGTGQSSIDGLVRATGLLLAGKVLVVAGYGWVGKGVAMRARGQGARVIVTEVDPIRALEAHLDGNEVMPMNTAIKNGEIFLTCTGQTGVITREHFAGMKDGAILGNCGHFDKEIDVAALKKLSKGKRGVRQNVEEYLLDGKSLFLLCEGRVVNLVAAEGHPPEVMQLSFATQLLSLYYLVEHKEKLKDSRENVLQVPPEIESLVSDFALSAFNLKIDKLSRQQEAYHRSFNR